MPSQVGAEDTAGLKASAEARRTGLQHERFDAKFASSHGLSQAQSFKDTWLGPVLQWMGWQGTLTTKTTLVMLVNWGLSQ